VGVARPVARPAAVTSRDGGPPGFAEQARPVAAATYCRRVRVTFRRFEDGRGSGPWAPGAWPPGGATSPAVTSSPSWTVS